MKDKIAEMERKIRASGKKGVMKDAIELHDMSIAGSITFLVSPIRFGAQIQTKAITSSSADWLLSFQS